MCQNVHVWYLLLLFVVDKMSFFILTEEGYVKYSELQEVGKTKPYDKFQTYAN